jgi:hypothetical protein
MDDAEGSLEQLLELAERDQRDGLPDAPWPPHFAKQEGEEPRVQPSKRRANQAAGAPGPAGEPVVARAAPGKTYGASGRRRTAMPLIEIARAASKSEALAGLERWKQRHPEAAARLQPADILIDAMRGRSSTWTRVRLNLRNVPAEQRPEQEALDVDYDPWNG